MKETFTMDFLAMMQAVPGVGPALPYVLMVFGICAVVAAQLPPPTAAGSLYGLVYQFINLLGHNYNQARNVLADTTKAATTVPPTAAVALLAVLVLPLGLGACSGAGSNPAADVAALESGLTAAEALATTYIQLPICTGTNGPLCSDTNIVAQIKTADAQAYTLVKAAEQAAGTPSALSAAEAAVTALTSIIDTLPKQGS
jgi:hypothetical protein